MLENKKYTSFSGKILMVGFGSIGKGVLPLILRHISLEPSQITVITACNDGREVAEEYGVNFRVEPLTKENYLSILKRELKRGDFLVNLSVDVSSCALIEYCQNNNILYLDTCIEPWPGGYTDPSIPPSLRSNYALREKALSYKKPDQKSVTSVLTHGANPGLVSHFVKQALINIANDSGHKFAKPKTHGEWSKLAKDLDIKVIHIAERDTQYTHTAAKKPGEFVNTWSVDGFISEGSQPAELGWGSHERHWPKEAKKHDFGCNAAIYLERPGASTRVRTWTPLEGPFHGFMITHNESISIADYFTLKNGSVVDYRPTVHYAYHPCDEAIISIHELAGKNWSPQEEKRILMDEITDGVDELGVLLMGHKKNSYWYGSQLSIHEARKLVPYNNATSLQVTVAVLAGMIWAIENPEAGVVEADEIDFERIMEISKPYLGKMVGHYSNWTPLENRSVLFEEDIDSNDPWQFKNFRVA